MLRSTALLVGTALLATAAPLAAQSTLCTIQPFAADNGGTRGGVVFLDLDVTNAVRITAFDTNVAETTAFGFDVYTTGGSYIGNETTASAWTLAASDDGTAVGAGRDQPSRVTLATPLVLDPGRYGIAIQLTGASHEYTNGDGSNQNFADANLAIALGAAQNVAFSSPVFAPRVWNGCIHYTPASGLFADFDATPTSGPAPLDVQFTDRSFTSDPGGITAWDWDLDGDGNVDSNDPNPTFQYAPGRYDVALTVTDATGQQTRTRTDLVVSDPLNAAFSASATTGAVPLTVQFTDASEFAPTAWAWDLDGDGNIDSNDQNPTFTYTVAGTYTVSLEVTNAAFTDTETRTDLIVAVGATTNTRSAEILEFTFNEPRGARVANSASTTRAPAFGTLPHDAWQGDSGREAFMGNDPGTGCLGVDATAPFENRVDTGWDIAIDGSHSITFWTHNITGTTSFGYVFGAADGSGSPGRCFYTGAVLSLRGWGEPPLPFVDTASDPETLVGWQHWALVVDDVAGSAQWYLNGTPDGAAVTFPANTFSFDVDGHLWIGAYADSTNLITRHYQLDDFRLYDRALTPTEVQAIATGGENPITTTFGDGCTGPTGVPTIGAGQGPPELGNTAFTIDCGNLEIGVPQVLNLAVWTSEPGLPVDLDPLLPNGSGCFAEIFPDLIGVSLPGNATGSYVLPIPSDPTLAGFHIFAQVIAIGSEGAVSPALIVNPQQ